MGRYADIREIENDMALVLRGEEALFDMLAELRREARWGRLSLLNQQRLAEYVRAAQKGLRTAHKWEAWIRNGRHLAGAVK